MLGNLLSYGSNCSSYESVPVLKPHTPPIWCLKWLLVPFWLLLTKTSVYLSSLLSQSVEQKYEIQCYQLTSYRLSWTVNVKKEGYFEIPNYLELHNSKPFNINYLALTFSVLSRSLSPSHPAHTATKFLPIWGILPVVCIFAFSFFLCCNLCQRLIFPLRLFL